MSKRLTRREANAILEAWKRGANFPRELIDLALTKTGDLSASLKS